jgi:hypothetical protein
MRAFRAHPDPYQDLTMHSFGHLGSVRNCGPPRIDRSPPAPRCDQILGTACTARDGRLRNRGKPRLCREDLDLDTTLLVGSDRLLDIRLTETLIKYFVNGWPSRHFFSRAWAISQWNNFCQASAGICNNRAGNLGRSRPKLLKELTKKSSGFGIWIA